ncbi:hypothetical protein [Algibacter sp. PT7-4]|uniref:hypothetical protein n=1 Tax=Algibacter ulvanivorans TaxID=3400999 RepID=UPI003AAFED07
MNNWQLIIIIGLVTILVALCIWFLFENQGNEKVIELSFKSLLVPVVIAFGLFLFELFKPLEIKKDKMVFSITEDPFILNRLVTHHEGTSELVNRGTMETTVFYAHNKDSLPLTSDKNKIEIAEIILLHLINKRYSQHWQVDYEESEPFFDMTSSVTSRKNDADNDITIMDEKTLHSIYPENHLIQKINSEIKFVLPSKTKYSVLGNENKRTILIKNKYISTNISIESIGPGTLPHNTGKTASLIRKKLSLPLDDSYRLNFYGYVLKMEIRPKRLLKWNLNTIEQTEWLTELFEYLRNSYSWESILNQLEENNYS